MNKKVNELVDRLTKNFVDDGLLIEAGWQSLRAACLPAKASEIQLSEMRKAFFAGAQHLYASIMSFLEADTEPTEIDMQRMRNIDKELRAFVEQLKAEYNTRNN